MQPHTDSADAGRVHIEKSTKHHGIALWPPPSTDPKDPLRWPYWVKIGAILAAALTNFTASFAAAGFSVAAPVLQGQFQKSTGQVNMLLTFNFLLLGVGNMFWIPLATKFGKRPILVVSMAMLFAVLIWTAEAKTFGSLLAARCLSGFASAGGESLVPAIVSDIFFLHERAAMMAIFVILVSSATAIGPLVAGFVIADYASTWRAFGWVCAAIAGFNLLALFFLLPESNFHRPQHYEVAASPDADKVIDAEKSDASHVEENVAVDEGVQHVAEVHIDWPRVWLSTIQNDTSLSIFGAFARPFTCLIYPDVLWAVFVYGTALAAQVILIFNFPYLLLAPPYLFKTTDVGLIQVAAIIGFIIACFGGGFCADLVTTWQIRRAKGVFFQEQRLVALAPGAWVQPVGCIIVAFTCADKLSWVGIAFGFGMLAFGNVFSPNIAITYVVESHPDAASDCLVVINVFKNLVAFCFLYVGIDWVDSRGYIQVYMIMFMVVSLAMLLAIPLYFYGERLRSWSERTRTRRIASE